MKELVSVIIPTFNRRRVLCECVDSVMKQEYSPIEIIVVDDKSDDDTIDFLSLHYKEVVLVKSEYRCGPAHLRNKGIKKAKGKYILFLDSDVIIPDPAIISNMVRILKSDGKIGEIGGEVPVYIGMNDIARGIKLDWWGYGYYIHSSATEDIKHCDYLASCNCMVRKQLAETVGGFDPYYLFGAEDLDFGYSIKKMGHKNLLDFNLAVLHRHSLSGRSSDEKQRLIIARIRFILKHFSLFKVLLIFLRDILFMFMFYPVMLARSFTGKLLKKKSIVPEWASAYFMIKAYLLNFMDYSKIRSARHKNFLSQSELEKYERFVSGE